MEYKFGDVEIRLPELRQKYIVSKRRCGYMFANELVVAREIIRKKALEEV